MSRNFFLRTALLFTVVLTLTFMACGDAEGGPSGDTPGTVTYTGTDSGTTYTLVITENTSRYVAQAGDTYTLTVGGKTSSGTVTNAGTTLILKPSNSGTSFTATVSGNGITGMTGTITFTDNSTVPAPASLIPDDGDGLPPSVYRFYFHILGDGENVYNLEFGNDQKVRLVNYTQGNTVAGTARYSVSGSSITFSQATGMLEGFGSSFLGTTATLGEDSLVWGGYVFVPAGTDEVVKTIGDGAVEGWPIPWSPPELWTPYGITTSYREEGSGYEIFITKNNTTNDEAPAFWTQEEIDFLQQQYGLDEEYDEHGRRLYLNNYIWLILTYHPESGGGGA